MIAEALDAGVSAAWVTGDGVCGSDPHLSAELERRQVGYVLAVSRKRTTATRAGVFRVGGRAHGLPQRAWQRLSAGAGAKGHRFYDWAQVTIDSPPASPGQRSARAAQPAYRRTCLLSLAPPGPADHAGQGGRAALDR